MTIYQAMFVVGFIGTFLLYVDEMLMLFKDKEPKRRWLRRLGLFGTSCLYFVFLVAATFMFMYAD